MTEKETIKKFITNYKELHTDWEQYVLDEIKDIGAKIYLETMMYHDSYYVLKNSEDFREELLSWCDHNIWDKNIREQECTKVLEGIDNPEMFVAFAKEWMKYGQITPLVKQIFEFVNEVYELQQPRLTHIGFIQNTDDDQPEKIPFINIWAGVGESNPIQRISHFRNALIKISNEDSIYNIKQIVTETLKP